MATVNFASGKFQYQVTVSDANATLAKFPAEVQALIVAQGITTVLRPKLVNKDGSKDALAKKLASIGVKVLGTHEAKLRGTDEGLLGL